MGFTTKCSIKFPFLYQNLAISSRPTEFKKLIGVTQHTPFRLVAKHVCSPDAASWALVLANFDSAFCWKYYFISSSYCHLSTQSAIVLLLKARRHVANWLQVWSEMDSVVFQSELSDQGSLGNWNYLLEFNLIPFRSLIHFQLYEKQ